MKYILMCALVCFANFVNNSNAIVRQTFIAVVYCNDNIHQFFTRFTSTRSPNGFPVAVTNNQGVIVYPVVYLAGRDPVTLCARFGGVLGVGQVNFANFPLSIRSDTGNVNILAISQPITAGS